MLLHSCDGGVVCIGQAAHSWVSGRLARQWGNGGFAAPEPLAEVCLGAEQHDIGMAESDRRPELDEETGFPFSFLQLPVEAHIAMWTDAPQRILSQSPYAALLISMHGHALFKARRQSPEIARYVSEQEAFQQGLLERIGEDPARARRNQQLVWVWDFLALVGLIPEWARTQATPDGDIDVTVGGPQEVVVDPWPFAADRIEISYPGRLLAERSATTQELHARLADAPWVEVPVLWRPA